MKHKYKRRTLDESVELAQKLFRASVSDHLSKDEIEEMKMFGTMISGNPSEIWEHIIGYKPDNKLYYEIEIYKPSDICPYIEPEFCT